MPSRSDRLRRGVTSCGGTRPTSGQHPLRTTLVTRSHDLNNSEDSLKVSADR